MARADGRARFGAGRNVRRANHPASAWARLAAAPWEGPVIIFTLASLLYSAVELGLPSMILQQAQPRLEQAAAARFTLCASPRHDNCVIDGDTIRHGGNSIRIADINTPEARGYQCAAEAVLARQASLRLLDLLAEGPFEIRRTGSRDTDIYGRQLRVLVRDGQSLGMQLVAEGLAHPWEGSRRSWCG